MDEAAVRSECERIAAKAALWLTGMVTPCTLVTSVLEPRPSLFLEAPFWVEPKGQATDAQVENSTRALSSGMKALPVRSMVDLELTCPACGAAPSGQHAMRPGCLPTGLRAAYTLKNTYASDGRGVSVEVRACVQEDGGEGALFRKKAGQVRYSIMVAGEP